MPNNVILFLRVKFIKYIYKWTLSQPYPIYSNPDSPNSQSRLPDSEFLRFESQQSIRIITLDRPASLHALNFDMVNELTSALRTWTASDSVRAIVLKGAPIPSGKKSFCAGGDVVRKPIAFIAN